jgi:hypothetical protein
MRCCAGHRGDPARPVGTLRRTIQAPNACFRWVRCPVANLGILLIVCVSLYANSWLTVMVLRLDVVLRGFFGYAQV